MKSTEHRVETCKECGANWVSTKSTKKCIKITCCGCGKYRLIPCKQSRRLK